MTTPRDIPRWLATAHAARADVLQLHAYVAALPDADRVAYYYAHPDYCTDGTSIPAYVLHEAVRKSEMFGLEAGDRRIEQFRSVQLAQQLADHSALVAPSGGDRILAVVGAVARWSIAGAILAAVGYVAGGPHIAMAGLTLAGCVGALAVMRAMFARELAT